MLIYFVVYTESNVEVKEQKEKKKREKKKEKKKKKNPKKKKKKKTSSIWNVHFDVESIMVITALISKGNSIL